MWLMLSPILRLGEGTIYVIHFERSETFSTDYLLKFPTYFAKNFNFWIIVFP